MPDVDNRLDAFAITTGTDHNGPIVTTVKFDPFEIEYGMAQAGKGVETVFEAAQKINDYLETKGIPRLTVRGITQLTKALRERCEEILKKDEPTIP